MVPSLEAEVEPAACIPIDIGIYTAVGGIPIEKILLIR